MSKIILADPLIDAVCKASGVRRDRTRAVIIEARVGKPINVYFDCIGDDALLELVPPLAMAPGVRRYFQNGQGEHVEVTAAA